MVKVEIELKDDTELHWFSQFHTAIQQYRAAGSPPKPKPEMSAPAELPASFPRENHNDAPAEAQVVGRIEPKLTMEDVVAAASAYFNKNNDVAANYALLKTFGVNRVTELTPDKWAAFHATVTK